MTGLLRLFSIIILVLAFGSARAQPAPTDTAAPGSALARAIQSYHDFMGQQSLIYNGPDHYDYPQMTGDPYFEIEGVQKGSVLYDGILYTDMPVLYDLVRDQLIVFNYSSDLIGLSPEKVKEFAVDGHHFVHLSSGYYDILRTGKVSLQAKRVKTIEESIVDLQVVYTAVEKDHYYAIIGGVYYPLGNLNSLLALLKDKKKEIRQELRKKKIRYRKEPERALAVAVQYYNQSSH